MQLPQSTVEKNKIFMDTLEHKIPTRVPISPLYQIELVLQYAGFDLRYEQFSLDKWIEALDIFSRDFDVDTMGQVAMRFPAVYKMLGSKNYVIGGNGFLQHPNVVGMEVNDYDSLIENPYDTIVETVIPKIHTNLNTTPQSAAEIKSKAFFLQMTNLMKIGQASTEIAIKYGKSTCSLFSSMTEAPLDFLADQLRSFTGVSGDIRRYGEKVEAACEALLPLMIKMGAAKGPVGTKDHVIFIPLHMAPYMREKDFERFYWPTFKKLIVELDKMGYSVYTALEQDWSRYADYLLELPDNVILWVECGEPKMFKEKLGNKHILNGFYPLDLVKHGTKAECEDEIKRLFDIVAPGGGYIFNFDKEPLILDDINVDNFKAIIKTAKEYGVY